MMTRITVGLWSDTAAGMIEREREFWREQDGNKTDGQDVLERLEGIISTVQ